MIGSFLSPARWPAAAAAASALMLAAAHGFERFMNLYPCPLCLRQREAYWAALGLGLAMMAAARFAPALNRPRAGAALLGLVFAAGAAIAGYHAGVEWGFFTPICPTHELEAGASIFDQLNGQKIAKGSCETPALVVLGLSMAGWNCLVSAALAALSFIAAATGSRPVSPTRRQEA